MIAAAETHTPDGAKDMGIHTNISHLVTTLAPEHSLHIDGARRVAASVFAVEDPATGLELCRVPDASETDAIRAVDAAAAALPGWAARPPRARAEALRRVFDAMTVEADLLTALIVAENGKSESDARAEVAYAAEFFRWFSEEAVRSDGDFATSPAGGTRTLVTHRPVGVAALVTPWNFPAAMATRKIAPALAAGCSVVFKPAAETPLTALAIVGLMERAGVPAGVVNVVTTSDPAAVVGTWLADPRVRKLSFTGSTGVGKVLLKQAADRVVNASMELGGNAPFIVTADADVPEAVAGAMLAKFRNGGQACTAANRFYIHKDVVEPFVAEFGRAIEALQVGPGNDPASEIGPMISSRARGDIRGLITAAVSAGATVAHQGMDGPVDGWFLPPTLLTDVAPDAAILDREIFGPVAPVVTWRDESELLSWVNGTESGLAAYVYAGRLQDALRLAERTEAGMVGINRGIVSDPAAPFGGMKQSGLGREGARAGLREFQETQYFSVDWT